MRNCTSILFLFLITGLLFSGELAGQEVLLRQTSDFGHNPGNLQMYSYEPNNLPHGKHPLVVVLHGCTQTAHEVASQTGWNKLADSLQFYVLYPQTHFGNNVTRCFRWFKESDIASDEGESYSIYHMIDHFVNTNAVDTGRIYITGLSAGGAMAVAMLARYPALFHAGAIVAGGPYGAAMNLNAARKAMKGKVNYSADEWAEKVRSQNPDFTGDYPPISVFHGTKDKTVNPLNAEHLIAQWTGLYHLDNSPARVIESYREHEQVQLSQYNTASGKRIARLYMIKGGKHALSIATGDALHQGGKTGRYTSDTGFHIPWQCAIDFGLTTRE